MASEVSSHDFQSPIANQQSPIHRTLRLTLAYDGTDFAGWQVQPGQRTVQETIEQTIARVTGETVRVFASGRTDSGVHAQGQVVSFETQSAIPADALGRAINTELPPDVVIVAAAEAEAGFNALRDAVRKRYRYVIDNGRTHDVFRRRYAWHYRQPLDADRMQRAGAGLVGRHDFSSFESTGSPRASSVRNVFDLTVARQPPPDDHLIYIEIEADGFLYNMVRAIAGTLVDVGRGAEDDAWPARVLAGRDRSAAGATAPPQGLTLLWVRY
jgi:tRNA pseudouridine38-40 synthase